MLRKLSLALFCACVFAQDAPPEGDAALRARVDRFYQAHISGNFRDAISLVADDSLNAFIGASKQTYKECKTSKIDYSENFTRALVTEACQGEFPMHGRLMNVMLPLGSRWKLVDGQWYWYLVKETEVRTPFGISRATPEADSNARDTSKPIIPGNIMEMAKTILQGVKIDKTEIRLDSAKANEDAVEITNGMPGPVSISIDKISQFGLTAKADRTEIKAGEKTRVVFRYDPEGSGIECADCAKRVNGTVTAQIRVQPTAQVFPINIAIIRSQVSEK